jgi:hypothetical protein
MSVSHILYVHVYIHTYIHEIKMWNYEVFSTINHHEIFSYVCTLTLNYSFTVPQSCESLLWISAGPAAKARNFHVRMKKVQN